VASSACCAFCQSVGLLCSWLYSLNSRMDFNASPTAGGGEGRESRRLQVGIPSSGPFPSKGAAPHPRHVRPLMCPSSAAPAGGSVVERAPSSIGRDAPSEA
jgi:hypothetical protein